MIWPKKASEFYVHILNIVRANKSEVNDQMSRENYKTICE